MTKPTRKKHGMETRENDRGESLDDNSNNKANSEAEEREQDKKTLEDRIDAINAESHKKSSARDK